MEASNVTSLAADKTKDVPTAKQTVPAAPSPPSPQHLAAQFWAASSDALFKQPVIAAALNYSESWCERSRWDGTGPRFLKIGRGVVYRKRDVLEWLEKHQPVASTSEYPSAA